MAKTFRITMDARFTADDIDDACAKLARHFLKVSSQDNWWFGRFFEPDKELFHPGSEIHITPVKED